MNHYRFFLLAMIPALIFFCVGIFLFGCGDDDDDDDDDNDAAEDDDDETGNGSCDENCYSSLMSSTLVCDNNQSQCMGGCGEENDGCQTSCEEDWTECITSVTEEARSCAEDCDSCLYSFYDCYGAVYSEYNDCVIECEYEETCMEECYDDYLPDWLSCDETFQNCATWYDAVCHGTCETERTACDEACAEYSAWQDQWNCYIDCDDQATECRLGCM